MVQFLLSYVIVASAVIAVSSARIAYVGHRSNYHKDPLCGNGLFGSSCNKECLRDDHCKRHCPKCVSALCSPNGLCQKTCIVGWWHGCNLKCSTGCVGRVCDVNNGSCKRGCKSRFFGVKCTRTCPRHCIKGSCNQHSGVCSRGCVKGWFGQQCDKKCYAGCKGQCIRDDGSCLGLCIAGWYGKYCNISCSSGCVGGDCDSTSGSCIYGCTSTSFGNRCENTCSSNCLDNKCEGETSVVGNIKCTHGCVHGWWGIDCHNACPQHCQSCNRITGVCNRCNRHLHGSNCTRPCNTGCRKSQCSVTGSCTKGCRDGFYLPDCSVKCRPHCSKCGENGVCSICTKGFYGQFCNHTCSVNCNPADCNSSSICRTQVCDKNSGTCSHGCKQGWFGGQCNRQCSTGCKEGYCNLDDGFCVESCVPGFYLLNCSSRCPRYCRRCRREDGVCTDCDENRTGGDCTGRIMPLKLIVLTGFLMSVAVLLLMICFTVPRRGLGSFCQTKVLYLNAVYERTPLPSVEGGMLWEDDQNIYEEIGEPIMEPQYATIQRNNERL